MPFGMTFAARALIVFSASRAMDDRPSFQLHPGN
jgi:hypothetical protein